MSHHDNQNDSPSHKRRRLTSFKSVIEEVIELQSFQQFLLPALEPLLRKVVKEEVELALRKHLRKFIQNSVEDNASPPPRSFKLHFLNKIYFPVFTTTQIGGENWSTMRVALLDADSGDIVNTGSMSSSKVEILVLEGDFDCGVDDGWTVEEFQNNIVKERDGKKPLINGDVFVNLKDGVGYLGEITFTDNSSWTRSRKFRLGARVVDCFEGIRIREAKSEPFVVRDQRGELYKKHHPPVLSDEVWRLEKIGKDGAFHRRLSMENIHTVKDYLTLFYLSPSRLRKILGSGMSEKMWEVTTDHAQKCTLDKKLYVHTVCHRAQLAVVFNVVGKLTGMLSGNTYVSADDLSDTKKAEAQNHVLSALQHHWGDVAVVDEDGLLTESRFCPSAIGPPPPTGPEAGVYGPHPPASALPAFSPVSSFGFKATAAAFDDYTTLGFDVCSGSGCGLEELGPEPAADDPFFLDPGFCTTGGRLRWTAQMRWRMVFSVIQWFSVRRIVKRRIWATQWQE